ncbi:hypothetical protein GCM10020219_013450 [Nonomuraea dietziae]
MNVRLRATIAATIVVAVALGIAAAVLVSSLKGSLERSANAEAARKVVSAVPIAVEAVPAQQATRTTVATDPDVQLVNAATTRAAIPWQTTDDFAVATMDVATKAGTVTVWGRASLAGAEEALATLNGLLLPGVPLLLAVVAGMTWFSVGRALAPVAAIRTKVADITARDLHQRVPVPDSGDEIAKLATTVNGTLDRLETAVERHKRFVADAAHELRSPIATLRARLELAPPTEDTTEALADLARLQALAGDLLLLARLDAGEPLRTEELDLGQVAAEESARPGQVRGDGHQPRRGDQRLARSPLPPGRQPRGQRRTARRHHRRGPRVREGRRGRPRGARRRARDPSRAQGGGLRPLHQAGRGEGEGRRRRRPRPADRQGHRDPARRDAGRTGRGARREVPDEPDGSRIREATVRRPA